MLLGGLWHGAAWNFVIWGFYQGSCLCIYRIWRDRRSQRSVEQTITAEQTWKQAALRLIAIVGFFFITCYGWLLFRAHSLAQILHFSSLLIGDFGDMHYSAGVPRLSSLLGMALLLLMELAQYWTGDRHFYRRFPAPIRGFQIAAMLAIIMIGMSNEPAQFIYFQF